MGEKIFIKNIAKTIIGFILVFLLFYLIGSFIEASFDISTWDVTFKAFMSFYGLILGVVAQLAIHNT
ncbi:hypothetical protein [Flagellimonas nanhaiensis]|uniref:Uncharacterized protein n=1 Tax=Flagellimonas nanhaiensis TaxID=2292706 RepID=A0A371JKV2_9FLAO|nr:hypothetical protein [Allomuricauda nanhaiensis]RDY57558.1 hypothetical protein DX873_18540 [Allomuricauda nanhaiensis]